MTTWTKNTQLGPYALISPIGTGGMGEVWKARDTRLNRIVAVKRLKEEHRKRFEQEARAIAALNHPHICQLYDVGPDYLVMEYIEGTPPQCPLPADTAVQLAIQIASALEEAHSRGIIHRDLKPANILVTASGTAKLLDFGLAKPVTATDSDVTRNTMDGAVMGTAAYLSPEQAEGKPLDARSDIFSFGAVLYEMLSGSRAFEGSSMAQVLSAVLRDDPRPLQHVPPALQRIVSRCLAKEPGQRFPTMSDVKSALEQVPVKSSDSEASIAVLPFTNMSADKENEYFSDGLAEEIINALAHIRDLKVIARTSAFAFKGKQEDIRRIAEVLNVAHVLEGSVRRAGNRIRVTAQLIAAADGRHLWSERYDRELADVFAIQDEIAQAIAAALQMKLTAMPAGQKRYTPTLPAYEAFLRGRHHLFKFTPESWTRGTACLAQAIALDPEWAQPHAEAEPGSLASGYEWAPSHAGRGPSDPRRSPQGVEPRPIRSSAARGSGLSCCDRRLRLERSERTVSASDDCWGRRSRHPLGLRQFLPPAPRAISGVGRRNAAGRRARSAERLLARRACREFELCRTVRTSD